MSDGSADKPLLRAARDRTEWGGDVSMGATEWEKLDTFEHHLLAKADTTYREAYGAGEEDKVDRTVYQAFLTAIFIALGVIALLLAVAVVASVVRQRRAEIQRTVRRAIRRTGAHPVALR